MSVRVSLLYDKPSWKKYFNDDFWDVWAENIQISQHKECAKVWLHNRSPASNRGGQMCVGKTTDVIWECSELWVFELRPSRFHRNRRLIRRNQGPDFLRWINLTHTACSLSSLGFHWLSISPVMERTPEPGRIGLVPILNWIANTHLVIKLLWALQWEDGGGATLGSGVGTCRLPRGISHKVLSLHLHLQPLLWEQRALKGWKTKQPPPPARPPSMCSRAHRKDSSHVLWVTQAAC